MDIDKMDMVIAAFNTLSVEEKDRLMCESLLNVENQDTMQQIVKGHPHQVKTNLEHPREAFNI